MQEEHVCIFIRVGTAKRNVLDILMDKYPNGVYRCKWCKKIEYREEVKTWKE